MTFLENLFPWFGEMRDMGGDILLLIILLAAVLWALIIERLWYVNATFSVMALRAQKAWQARSERRSWHAHQYRRFLLYQSRRNLFRNISFLTTLIKLCPLLGLLGTVLGMLEIFDAIAITGGNNPRTTAAGVSKAIITTMAGMVVAISALPVVGLLNRRADKLQNQLADRLPVDG